MQWKTISKTLFALIASMMLFASCADAQTAGTNTVERNGYYFNSSPGIGRTDADGNKLVNLGNEWTYFSRIYSDTISTAGKNEDSTGVYNVSNLKRKALMIYPLGVTAVAGTAMHLAMSIRTHFQAATDSSSSFQFARYAGANARWPTAGADSIGHIGNPGAPATSGAAGTCGFNEVVLTVRPDVDMTSIDGRGPKGIYVPIPDDFGPYIDIRFRILDQLTSSGGSGLKRGRFDVALVGVPQ